MDFSQDSLFTLTPGQIVGVLLIGLLLAVLCLWGLRRVWRLTPRPTFRTRPVRVASALAIAYMFEWLSPQVYYGYYLVIFDGLPLQWVIKAPPHPVDILKLMTLVQTSSLSELGRAGLYWSFFAAALFPNRPEPG